MDFSYANRVRHACMAAALAILVGNSAHADDASPDPTFGTAGTVSFAVVNGATALRISGIGHIAQADGSILVATSHTVSDAPLLALRRLHHDGTLDTGFGTDGVRMHSLPACGTAGTPIVAQAVPGNRSLVSIGNCTVRLLADGTIDTAYGTGGFVSDVFNQFPQFLRADSQGRALNFRRNSTDFAFEVKRLTDTGAVDTTFGVNGSGVGQFVTGSGVWNMWEVFVQADDKPVVMSASGAMNGLGRWTVTGMPDTNFGTAGTASVACPKGSAFCDATGGIERADGKITLAIIGNPADTTRVSGAIVDDHGAPSSPTQTYTIENLPTLGSDAGGSDIRGVALSGDRSALVFRTRDATVGSTLDIVVLCLRADATLDSRCGASGYRLLDTVIDGTRRGSESPRWVSYDDGMMVISAITTIDQENFATIWRLSFDGSFANGFE